ncbi:ABC transporter six-transmembrane domain-containing protein [Thalassomonas sp. RHCl1]|uniref:ABC transporter six-transmembrane domain-containing protein n=1 Tax=Thalassomonas sp. RHCl1 TaxID=2995320 RepID=UPI00248C554C|nr:ABC transporter six-transmembrane domain-containing protein [Thalassomonas sp. RHCl1]
MMSAAQLGVLPIIKHFPVKLISTWLLVVLENVLLALIPLYIGFAIDDLLTGGTGDLLLVGGLLALLTLLSVLRRIYDTRVYGDIKVSLGMAVDSRNNNRPVSLRNARLDMARELVDFLEHELPQLMTAVIQILITLVVLSSFHWQLSATALTLTLAMLFIYALLDKRFYLLNGKLNGQVEKQVATLKAGARPLLAHLMRLKKYEVKLSDTEALLYGAIFLLACIFIITNLWLAAGLLELSSGKIFSIVSYSWDYVEAAILLPVTMQTWSRLKNITLRLNESRDTQVTLQTKRN